MSNLTDEDIPTEDEGAEVVVKERPDWFKGSLLSPVTGAEADTVRAAQLIMGIPQTGVMDPATKSHLRGFQRLFGIPVTGTLDERTAIHIDSLRWVE